jgi:hypothetical protein
MPLPDEATAARNLFDTVGQQVFFHTLAGRGYPLTGAPENMQKQAAYLLDLAGQVNRAAQAQATKEAQTSTDPYLMILRDYQDRLTKAGVDVGRPLEQEQHASIMDAAARYAQDPILYDSALAVKAAEAAAWQQLAQQQAA